MPRKAWRAFGVLYAATALGILLPAAAQACAAEDPSCKKTVSERDPGISIPSPGPELTRAQAIRKAAARSPLLIESLAEIRIREGECLQASFFPNPELSVEIENIAGSGPFSNTGNAETTVSVSQELEGRNKRRCRQQLAAASQAQAETAHAATQSQVLAQASIRFTTLLAAQMRVTLATESLHLAEEALGAVEARIGTGKTAAMEANEMAALVADRRIGLERAHRRLYSARLAMAESWNSTTPDFGQAKGDLAHIPPLPSDDDIRRWRENAPAIRLGDAAAARNREVLAYEKAENRLPLTAAVGVKHLKETGDHALVFGISAPLPIFDRNRGNIQAAGSRHARSVAARHRMVLETSRHISETCRELRGLRREIHMLQQEALPNANRTFEAVRYGYHAGKFALAVVRDAQQRLIETRYRYTGTLEEYWTRFAELEGLLGRQLPHSPLTQTSQRGDQ